MKKSIIEISNLGKSYANGFHALKNINLDIHQGEIFALLGPNGAGKTTLISSICGIVNPTHGQVKIGGYDIITHYRKTRAMVGLVPQELTTDAFETVFATVSFSRGLFGKPSNPSHIEKVLKSLSLWEKRNNKIMTLSGGMKRRVLIAKALSHEPDVLFLDEPTAGVDVELRKSMWQLVHQLRQSGVTIVLTTHYIQEAEEMADRIGVINRGELVLVDEKKHLMKKFGSKKIYFSLNSPIQQIPVELSDLQLSIEDDGNTLVHRYDSKDAKGEISEMVSRLKQSGVSFNDLNTKQSSLEEIFVDLVNRA